MTSRLLAIVLTVCACALLPSAVVARGASRTSDTTTPIASVAPAAGPIVGPGNALTVSTDPAVVGQWSAPFDWANVAVHMMLLDTGKVLTWQQGAGKTDTSIWDPATNTFATATNATTNLFCAGHAPLPDGRILSIGGDSGGLGVTDISAFDPQTQSWTAEARMSFARWYPTGTVLPNGRMLTTSGSQDCRTCVALIPEIYDAVTNTWTQLPGASANIPLYPFMFVLGDGRVLHAGGSEVATSTEVLDVNAQTWTSIDPRIIDGGSAVMYAPGKILKAGSAADDGVGVPSAATAYVLDTTIASPAWRSTASMSYARSYLNLTLLPDDTVLATGGDSTKGGVNPANGVKVAEAWSPATETWTPLASMTTSRLYHSTALLLPDGRVLSAGSGAVSGAPNQDNAEIYSPPYLFKGPRPTISSSPTTPIPYGSNFFVGTPDAPDIASVTLIRTGSPTHAFDENTRRMPLAFTQTSGGLNITAPANANLAPPGDYMLFIVNSNGVPSIAPFVRFPVPSADTQPPTAPTNLTATGGAAASLSWTGSTDNVGVTGYNVYRGTTAGFTLSGSNRIATVPTTTYVDAAAPAGTSYYVINARDAAGNRSGPSNEASAFVVPPPTNTPTATNTAGGPTLTPTSTPSPTSTPAVTLDFGRTVSTGANDSGDSGYLNGSPATLSAAGTLASLSVYVGAAAPGSHIRLGLYANNGGTPGALLAQSVEGVAVAGWNTLPAAYGPALAAGSYWIFAQTDHQATVYVYATGLPATNAIGYTSFAYGAFPATIASALHLDAGQALSMYGSVYPAIPATATSTPTATNTSMPTNTPVPTATGTPSPTSTPLSATNTSTAIASSTPTNTPSATATAAAATGTPTNTSVPTATNTASSTNTATNTPVQVATSTASPTNTPLPATNTSTNTATATTTPTATNTAAPTSTPGASSLDFGRTVTTGQNDSGDAGYVNGSPATLSASGTLASLSIYLGAAAPGSHVRLAIYADNAGTPGLLLAQSAPAVAAAGWNTLPIAGGPALSAGSYWVFAQTDNLATVFRYATGLPAPNTIGWAKFAYAAFPATITGTFHRQPGQAFSMYGTVFTSTPPTPTNTPPATNTPVPTATNTATPTPTRTNTATATSTPNPAFTSTPTATATSTNTAPASTNTPTATPTTTGSATINFGRTATTGLDDTSDDGYLNGSPATLSTASTLSTLSVYLGTTAPGAHVRLALYSNDAGGRPGTLLAETAEGVAPAGWVTLPVMAAIPLAPGTYWVLAQTDSRAVGYRYAAGLPSTSLLGYTSQPYGPFPTTIASWHTQATYTFSMYGSATTP